MAFKKENVEMFLNDHALDLSAGAVDCATQEISEMPAGKMLVACEADRIFGCAKTARWFLCEIEGSPKHARLFALPTAAVDSF